MVVEASLEKSNPCIISHPPLSTGRFYLRLPAIFAPSAHDHHPCRMKKIDPWKTWTFIGALLTVAILVNGIHDQLFQRETPRIQHATDYREPQPSYTPTPSRPVVERPLESERERTVETIPQKTPEELAAERALFLARYMNARDPRNPGIETVGIVAVNENGKLNGSLATILANRIKGDGVKTLTSLFTPEFVSDGLFKDAFNDSPNPINALGLRDVADTLLLARQTVQYTVNTSLENVLTANMRLEVMRISVARRGESQTWTLTANGAGFKESDARSVAEERIIKQLSQDTNIVTLY